MTGLNGVHLLYHAGALHKFHLNEVANYETFIVATLYRWVGNVKLLHYYHYKEVLQVIIGKPCY
jgi:hypothetical protein